MEFRCTSKETKSKWKNFKGSPSDVQDTPHIVERLRSEKEDKTKTQMTQSFNQYFENETRFGAKIS